MARTFDETVKEIASYCEENIRNYESRLCIALDDMDRMRVPLQIADRELHDEIWDMIVEWFDDNPSVYSDDIVTEDIIFH